MAHVEDTVLLERVLARVRALPTQRARVYKLWALGNPYDTISRTLDISRSTMANHVTFAKDRVGHTTPSEALLLLVASGVLREEDVAQEVLRIASRITLEFGEAALIPTLAARPS